jgi:hypothetical protein
MGRDVLFSVLLGSAVLMGALPATAAMRGWKALLPPLMALGAIFLIWSLVSVHLPR